MLLALPVFLPAAAAENPGETFDVLIYGGNVAACAAAQVAAKEAPEARIALVVPYLAKAYGGLATAGGQNFWDVRRWPAGPAGGWPFPQAGSFRRWYSATGHFYGTQELADLLAAELGSFPNLRTFWQTDVEFLRKDVRGRPTRLMLRELVRGPDGLIHWGETRIRVKAEILVDASEDGRLARLAGVPRTNGRADWPPSLLGRDPGDRLHLQQAATLMFKVRGVRPGRYSDMTFVQDEDGTWGAFGGAATWREDPVMVSFNRRYGPQGFMLKPLNAAQDGKGSAEWWVNALLIFGVDGRANFRDRGTSFYPRNLSPGALEADRAWARARRFIQKPEFLAALRRFPGFEQAEIVRAKDGLPAVGDFLYLREVEHALAGSSPSTALALPGLEESAYAVTPREVYLAGANPQEGGDRENYPTRIGLGFYWLDINAYRYRDLLDHQGNPTTWPVTPRLRPDYPDTAPGAGARPQNPVYLPYEALVTPWLPNLLLAGAAASISSLAWAELRVLPNLAVLGDAAGAAAAYAFRRRLDPARFGPPDIAALQEALVQRHGARLEKLPQTVTFPKAAEVH